MHAWCRPELVSKLWMASCWSRQSSPKRRSREENPWMPAARPSWWLPMVVGLPVASAHPQIGRVLENWGDWVKRGCTHILDIHVPTLLYMRAGNRGPQPKSVRIAPDQGDLLGSKATNVDSWSIPFNVIFYSVRAEINQHSPP